MIVGDFCLTETSHPEVGFDCHCQNFHLCSHNGNRIYNQTTLFYSQTNSLSFAFIPRGPVQG